MRRRLSAFASSVLILSLSACSTGAQPQESGPFEDADAIAIVIANTANVPAPSLPHDLYVTLENARIRGVEPAIISAAGAPEVLNLRLSKIDPTEGSAAGNRKRASIDAGKINAALASPPTSEGLDMFEALAQATGSLSASTNALLILVGSGLSDRGVLDTTQGLLAADPTQIAESVRQAHSTLSLQGVRVVLAGFGYVAGPQQENLPSATRERLLGIWVAVLNSLGATEVIVDSSPVSGTAVETSLEVGVTEVDASRICEASTVRYTFDSSLLSFSKSNSEVDPGALDEVVQLLNSMVTGHVTITGHTDAEGDAHSNFELSRARAQAVAEFLSLGASESITFEVEAAGETDLLNDEDGLVGIQLAKAQGLNRRVDIDISGDQEFCTG